MSLTAKQILAYVKERRDTALACGRKRFGVFYATDLEARMNVVSPWTGCSLRKSIEDIDGIEYVRPSPLLHGELAVLVLDMPMFQVQTIGY